MSMVFGDSFMNNKRPPEQPCLAVFVFTGNSFEPLAVVVKTFTCIFDLCSSSHSFETDKVGPP